MSIQHFIVNPNGQYLVPVTLLQVMFLQRKGQVIMTIELLDTEETQTEDPVEVQVISQ